MDDSIKRKIEILEALKRRKHERELQAAKQGVNVDPVVIIEMEDLEKEIKELEEDINVRGSSVKSSSLGQDISSMYNERIKSHGCSISLQIVFLIVLFFVPLRIFYENCSRCQLNLQSLRYPLVDRPFLFLLLTIFSIVLLVYFMIWFNRHKR